MKYISHRGLWGSESEKNSVSSFIMALNRGYGIETDIRDNNCNLVISHDPASNFALLASEFLSVIQGYTVTAPHAINIKSDGLQPFLKSLLSGLNDDAYFVFDMSIPDTLAYLAQGFPVYLRCSEFEQPADKLLLKAKGVWLDAFESDWYDRKIIEDFLAMGKSICIVSPELHKRPHKLQWANLKSWGIHKHDRIQICTDFPQEAEQFFQP